VLYPSGHAAAQTGSIKIAFYNIQSGKGERALAGRTSTFADNANCTDATQPMNAWGVGFVQPFLIASLRNDAKVVALGLAEAWVCGSAENVRAVLGWKARSTSRNGVSMVARHGFAGPEQWLQLDTSGNLTPSDTKWVLRVPVCLDAACTQNLVVFAAHWLGDTPAMLDAQGRDTVEFMRTAGSAPHVLVGDLNAWEGVYVCRQYPTPDGLRHLRSASYIDAWPFVHGTLEGFTGMTNRAGCGIPEGYVWKRVDYAWSSPGYRPLSMTRFGMVTPGNQAPSDHYGIIAEFPLPSAPPPPAAGDVVLHTRHAAVRSGGWQIVQDASAAGGARLWQPDRGAAKIATALASPAHYFEISFTAEANRPYRLWMRARAERDHWSNDSVFAQFNRSVTSSGAAVYRIGSTSAAALILEDCNGCGVSGWGWQDNGYGAGVAGPLIYFAASGTQTVRVQAREDGISIDQLVLSPAQFLSTAPGGLKQDATILPATGGASAPSAREIVLFASAARNLTGAWRLVSDASAAGGSAVEHPDAGLPKITTAAAFPAHYVEFTFNAEAGRDYRLWLRSRAERNHWTNDSVFAQFSGTVDAGGRAVYRIGSTSAAVVVLEEASGAVLAGWGWQDNGYGLGVLGPVLRFETTGPQRLRLQTREDGLRIDQIVISSSLYLTAAPGAPRNDATILRLQ
jgi:hypothetical protein